MAGLYSSMNGTKITGRINKHWYDGVWWFI